MVKCYIKPGWKLSDIEIEILVEYKRKYIWKENLVGIE